MTEINNQVCVVCMTFNQSAYIKDTLDGFCMQQTTFPYVCIVMDDASTDGEQEVIAKYMKDNFNQNEEENTEEADNYVMTFAQHRHNKNCYFAVFYLKYNHYRKGINKEPYYARWRNSSKYLALCEGDDYWVHPQKIQMQWELMERNHAVGMCYTAYSYLYEPTGHINDIVESENNKPSYGFQWDVLIRNTVGTASVVMRTWLYDAIHERYKEDFKGYRMGDIQVWFHLARLSEIRYIPIVTMTYRKHEGSATALNDYEKSALFLKDMIRIRASLCAKYDAPVKVLKEINAGMSALMIVNHLLGRGYERAQTVNRVMLNNNLLVKLIIRLLKCMNIKHAPGIGRVIRQITHISAPSIIPSVKIIESTL